MAGSRPVPIGAPAELPSLPDPLPPSVTFAREPDPAASIVHRFTAERAERAGRLATCRRRWSLMATVRVSWPKKSSGVAKEVNERTVRELALPLGFVDVKVCAVTEVRPGLQLVVPKALRSERRRPTSGSVARQRPRRRVRPELVC